MSATALPLPLALSQPVPMASDLKTLLGADSAKYDPQTQVGVRAHGGTANSNTQCVNFGVVQVDDVIADIG